MPAGRIDTLASQRSDPSSMLTSETPSWRSVDAQQVQQLARLLGRVQVGLGDDLHQRRAAAVEVHDAAIRAVNPPALAEVDELGRVLLQVDAVDPDVAEPPAAAERHVVLGDLVALGRSG